MQPIESHADSTYCPMPNPCGTIVITSATPQEIVVGSNMDKIYIVMDYVEHDLKALMETMKEPFLQGTGSGVREVR